MRGNPGTSWKDVPPEVFDRSSPVPGCLENPQCSPYPVRNKDTSLVLFPAPAFMDGCLQLLMVKVTADE